MLGNATQPLIPMRPWEVHFKYPFRFFSFKKHFRFSKNDCFISLFIFHFYFAESLMNDGKLFQFFFICRFMVSMTKVLSRTPPCKSVNFYRCTGTFPTYCLNSNRLKDKHFTGQRHVIAYTTCFRIVAEAFLRTTGIFEGQRRRYRTGNRKKIITGTWTLIKRQVAAGIKIFLTSFPYGS